MPKYKNFYFLHIDKTIAINVDAVWMTHLYSVLEDNGVNCDLNKNHYMHNFWQEPADDTYLFTALREPSQRTTSAFSHTMLYDDFDMFRGQEDPYTLRHDLNHSIENFNYWLDIIHTPNYQSRLISNDYVFSLYDRLQRFNLIAKTTDFSPDKGRLLFNKILNDFEIDYRYERIPEILDATGWYGHRGDRYFYEHIENTDIHEKIKIIDKLDYDMWNNIPNLFN